MGGKASGKARRTQKTMRECAELLLSLPVTDQRKANKLARMGVDPEGMDNKMLLVAGLLAAACNGNVMAAKEIRNLIGEDMPVVDTDGGGVIEIAVVEPRAEDEG